MSVCYVYTTACYRHAFVKNVIIHGATNPVMILMKMSLLGMIAAVILNKMSLFM